MNRFVTKEAIEGLVKKLGLPAGDAFTQDWEKEIASSDLAIKLLKDYLTHDDLNDDEKFALMSLILECVNDYMEERGEFPKLDMLKVIIISDYSIHKSVIDKYAGWENEGPDEQFEITPFIRSVCEAAGL